MRNSFLVNLFSFLIILILFVSCEKDVPPIAKFSATKIEKDQKVYVTFFDESSNDANSWEWTISGYDTHIRTEQNPTFVLDKSGIYDVTLVVSNDGGTDEVRKDEFIFISRFNSLMPTDAIIQYEDENIILEAGADCLLACFGRSADCHIETSGTDINGEQIGILIYWDLLINFEYEYYSLGVTNELIFFNVINNSDSEFDYFMVNRGTEQESLEQFVIPNDGLLHKTGYYLANNNMEVRAYSQESYFTWNVRTYSQDNQVVNLTANKAKREVRNINYPKEHYPSIILIDKEKTEQIVSKNSVVLYESGYRFKD